MNKQLTKAYALLIGVGNDLPVTVRDATAIKNILADEELAGYIPENIYLLTEKQASRKGILEAFDNIIEQSDEDSSLLLFYSGHGGTYLDNDILTAEEQKPEKDNKRHFYLLPNNFDPTNFEETWVTADEIKQRLQKIRSKRLVFFLDCCHAEGMTKSASFNQNSSHDSQTFNEPEKMAQQIDDGQGISIISSCREDQQSYILEGDSNSLFTKCLLEVLKGKHKSHFHEPFIRITEVTQYLFKRVPELKAEQRPFVNLQIYDDFILSKAPEHLLTESVANQTDIQAEITEKKEINTVFRKTEESNSVILFLHGFTGEAAETFGQTPHLIIEDEQFDGWDLFPIGYTENIRPIIGNQVWASATDMEMMTDYISVLLKGKFSDYSRIAIVAHGLGGLIIQKVLLDLPVDILQKVSHLLLFGSPNSGISENHLSNEEEHSLQYLSRNSEVIRSLRSEWNNKFEENYPFLLRCVAATKDEYVSTESNFKPFGEEHQVLVPGNHFSMVKAASVEDHSYEIIRESLLGNRFLREFTSSEEKNLALGEYKAVVDELLPKYDQLDISGLENLCFALEGLDRDKEAMMLLTNHEHSKSNEDIISMLAGRFKRLYLQEYNQKDGEQAFQLYEKSLRFSKEKNDARKIYYNAINLAFLSVVFLNDLNKMQEYAGTAKVALEKDVFPSLWKLATQAECALYFADFETAKDYYSQAAKLAGLRERLSIYTNAKFAYTKLMNTTSQEDDFLRFLHQTFL